MFFYDENLPINTHFSSPGPVDNIPPVVTCINDIFQTISSGVAGTTVTWTEPTATDDSGAVTLASRSHTPGSFFPVGTTQVSYVFVDGAGNSASCTFSVEITQGKSLLSGNRASCSIMDSLCWY